VSVVLGGLQPVESSMVKSSQTMVEDVVVKRSREVYDPPIIS